MKALAGQTSIFDLVELPAETWVMEYCPECRSNWGASHGLQFKERLREEHALQPDGRCATMHRHGWTEPFYTVDAMKRTRVPLYSPEQIILEDFRTGKRS